MPKTEYHKKATGNSSAINLAIFFSIPYHCSSVALCFVLEYLPKNLKRAAHSLVASSSSSSLYVPPEVENQPLFPLKSNPIVHFSDIKWLSDKCELIIAQQFLDAWCLLFLSTLVSLRSFVLGICDCLSPFHTFAHLFPVRFIFYLTDLDQVL